MAGALLYVETQLVEVRSKTIKYIDRMFNSESDVLVASMELVIIYLDMATREATLLPLSDRLSMGKPADNPDAIFEAW